MGMTAVLNKVLNERKQRLIDEELAAKRKEKSFAKCKKEVLRLMEGVSGNFKKMAANRQVKKLIDKLFFDHYFGSVVKPSKFVKLFEIEVILCQFRDIYYLTLEKDLTLNFRDGMNDKHPIKRSVLNDEDALLQIKKILIKLSTPEGAINYLICDWKHAHIYFP